MRLQHLQTWRGCTFVNRDIYCVIFFIWKHVQFATAILDCFFCLETHEDCRYRIHWYVKDVALYLSWGGGVCEGAGWYNKRFLDILASTRNSRGRACSPSLSLFLRDVTDERHVYNLHVELGVHCRNGSDWVTSSFLEEQKLVTLQLSWNGRAWHLVGWSAALLCCITKEGFWAIYSQQSKKC